MLILAAISLVVDFFTIFSDDGCCSDKLDHIHSCGLRIQTQGERLSCQCTYLCRLENITQSNFKTLLSSIKKILDAYTYIAVENFNIADINFVFDCIDK